jgi:hypothetical protein
MHQMRCLKTLDARDNLIESLDLGKFAKVLGFFFFSYVLVIEQWGDFVCSCT